MKKKPFVHPGKMVEFVLRSLFKKPVTVKYPFEKANLPEKFRGELKFTAEKCIGCMLCMKDCPTNAITIRKVGEKKFEAEVDLAKCIYCGQCVDSCVRKALEITPEFELAQFDREKLKVVFHAPDTNSGTPKPAA